MTVTAEQLFGSGDLEAFFAGQDRNLVPWGLAPRRKHTLLIDDDDRRRLLTGTPALKDIDPRTLYASQHWVLAHHCRYYTTGTWERTGRPACDREKLANRYPLIHTDAAGHRIILGGHHRALVALLNGTPLRARLVRTHTREATAVLPRLLVGSHTALDHTAADDPRKAADLVDAGTTALVPDLDTARRALHALGLDGPIIEDRISVAVDCRVLTVD